MPLNILLLLGCGTWWGFSFALSRIVMEGGQNPLVIAFWQSAGSAALVWGGFAVMGKMPRIDMVFVRYSLMIGALGGAIPSALLYWAVAHVGAGVLSVCMATVPLMQFGFSAALGLERARPLRFVGIAIGLAAVFVIARPDGGAAPVLWVAVAMGAGFSYVLEEAFIAGRRPENISPGATMAGMVLASAVFLSPALLFADAPLPFAVLSPGPREWALGAFILGSPVIYGGFVWLIMRAGPVFSAQVAYVVTIAGVVGGVWFLGEAYEGGFWLALAMMIVALALGLPGGRAVKAIP
ncbi:MAG: DMT family transporter [Pikeienuella sp.]